MKPNKIQLVIKYNPITQGIEANIDYGRDEMLLPIELEAINMLGELFEEYSRSLLHQAVDNRLMSQMKYNVAGMLSRIRQETGVEIGLKDEELKTGLI